MENNSMDERWMDDEWIFLMIKMDGWVDGWLDGMDGWMMRGYCS